jgi:hypothetical protein
VDEDVAVHHQPDGPAFDIVLVLHVGCVVVGLFTMVTGASSATRLRKLLVATAPLPEVVVRYFRPGANWAGRTVYGIPVFGVTLLALSHGAYSFSDGWVTGGALILVLVVLVGEGALWPAERRLQQALVAGGGAFGAVAPALRDAKLMERSAAAVIVLLVVGSALMLAQP